jgi:hypothetical protein
MSEWTSRNAWWLVTLLGAITGWGLTELLWP